MDIQIVDHRFWKREGKVEDLYAPSVNRKIVSMLQNPDDTVRRLGRQIYLAWKSTVENILSPYLGNTMMVCRSNNAEYPLCSEYCFSSGLLNDMASWGVLKPGLVACGRGNTRRLFWFGIATTDGKKYGLVNVEFSAVMADVPWDRVLPIIEQRKAYQAQRLQVNRREFKKDRHRQPANG